MDKSNTKDLISYIAIIVIIGIAFIYEKFVNSGTLIPIILVTITCVLLIAKRVLNIIKNNDKKVSDIRFIVIYVVLIAILWIL